MTDTTTPASPVPPPAQPSVNILIVDDEPKNLAVLESVLDDPDYRLVRATSGEEALLALMAEEFAVLILDVRMPGMSGFEVAQLVKDRRKTARLPIIFLTAYYNEDGHILEGYGTGAVDFLHKPVQPTVLRSKVAVFAELYKKGRELAAANRMLLGEVAERRRAEARLSELAESLDRRVTERTRELQDSEARLLDAHRRKDEFLATLAHELRNPLAPLRSAVELIRHGAVTPAKLEWAAGMMERQVRALVRLIDDLMDVSRINRGKIELKREPLALNDVLVEVVETVRPSIDEARHELAVLMPDRQVVVDADRTRLAQALLNLLNNAVKYTDPGGRIELGVLVEKANAVITICDSGIGIAPEHLEEVFQMFSQVESALTRSRGGLGIGLSLTRRLIEMHGGTVRASSDGVGQGSRFQISLPLSAAAAPARADHGAEALEPAQVGLRILVADDNEDGASALAALLEVMGHSVRLVGDGEAAVRETTAWNPEVALLDIGMPRMNGFDACRRIRTLPGGAERTLIALTGWGQPQDVRRSAEAGFDRHLVKPIEIDALSTVLAAVVDERSRRTRPDAAAGQG
jgi:signal transduction histidine kinase